MTIEQFIKQLRNSGVKLKLEQQQLICELPQNGVTATLRAEIVARKEELKQFLQRHDTQDCSVKARGADFADASGLPLSCNQQVLWTDQQVHGCRSSFHMPFAFRLRGKLCRDALQYAVDKLVDRHEVLRTVYRSDEAGTASQFIQHSQAVRINEVVLEQAADIDDRLAKLLQHESEQPFDLCHDLMLRVTLVLLAEQEQVLLFTLHHIASDGWSMAVMMQEFTALYNGFISGDTASLPALQLQYADFALWQHNWLASDSGERALNYWKTQLNNLPVVHNLKLDYRRPDTQSFKGVTLKSRLEPEALSALRELCRQEGATLFMGLHAMFAILLARLSGEQDIVMGASAANRGQPELSGLIGFFVNMLVLRTDISGQATLRSLLQQSKQTLQAAYAHQQVPLVKLFETLKPSRSLRHNPLFQIVLVLQNNEQAELEFTDLECEPMSLGHDGSKYDLTLGALETDDGLLLSWEYNSDLFHPDTISDMAIYFNNLTAMLLTDPDSVIEKVSGLDQVTQGKLSRWQGEESEVTQDVWSLFERQAEVSAERIAVREGEFSWSYGELLARVSHWSGVLSAEGVKAGDAVGVLLERGMDAVTALLAIVRLGGRYVPLDGQYPASRLNWMLSDAGVSCVLSAGDVPSGLMAQRSLDVRTFDGLNVPLVDAARRTAVTGLYLMYTSGSTGTPKGVQVPDGAVVRLSCNRRELSIVSEDVLLLQAPLVFDASTLELWGALLNGASVAIGRPGAVSVEGLASDIRDYGVTVLWLTASLFHVVVDERLDALKGLRCLVAGGDALSGRHVSAYLDAPWSGELVNGYGPTEATTFSCVYRMEEHDARSDVPIGYPLEQSSCYVLDEQGQRVLPGVPGELYVGGAGLAHGYWGQGAKTAEAFVPNPYGAPGSRLYRTGDRVRYNRDGALEFLGRRDAQVKVRGYRIEPGEIEHALKGCEGVVHAVVWVQDEGGRKQLLAAVSGTVAPAQLTAYLQGVLPEYMQPHQLSVLADMPLTVNGKVDRAAVMRAQVLRREEGAEALSGAQSALESQLISIWQDVLQVEQIGRDESFFELGGDSILSIQLAARAASQGIAFSLEDLFEHDTVATLAAAIGAEQTQATQQSETQPFELITDAIRRQLPDTVEDAYPVSQLQQGMLYHSLLHEGKGIYHDILHYHTGLVFDEACFRKTVDLLTKQHPILRTEISLNTYAMPLQLVHQKVVPHCSIVNIKSDVQAGLVAWQQQELQSGFTKDACPLIRFTALITPESGFYVGLSFHHAILDGWSEATLVAELMALYSALLNGCEQPCTSLSSSYRDFIAREQSALVDQVQHDYWHSADTRNISRITLPGNTSANAEEFCTDTTHSSAVSCVLDTATSRNIRQLAAEQGCSLKTIMLSAHLKALSLACASDTVVSGVSFHGRPELVDSEKVLGLFVNILPVALSVSAGSWTQLINEVEACYKQVMQYRFYPLAEIKRRRGGEEPFEASFNYTQFNVLWQEDSEAGTQLNDQRGGVAENSLPFSINVQSYPDRDEIYLSVTTLRSHYAAGVGLSYSRLYRQVLAQMVANPAQSHRMLSEQAQSQLQEWNATTAAYPEGSVHQLVEQQAEANPTAIAVVDAEQQLTYGELNAQANRLARYLREQRLVSSETLVGICLERSSQLIVSILAVLKAGGAYVPLDPAYPQERLSQMLADAALGSVLTLESQAADWLPAERRVALDSAAVQDSLAGYATDNLNLACQPEQLAYVMYTSGSTGTPKGVMVEHRNIVSLLCGVDYVELNADTVTLLHSPAAFDATTFEIWGALFNGGRMALHQGSSADVDALAVSIERYGVTTLWLTAGLFDVFSDAIVRPLPQLGQLLVGGDVVNPMAVRAVQQRNPQLQCINCYGPTENTTFSTAYPIPPVQDGAALPIGRPLTNRQAYVLDSQQQRVPVGVSGELYVGGAGLARGYLNRPELTLERFIANPFAEQGSAERLYRTGDVVRWREDGQLEYLGRDDHQVKVRGYRIELGEIESALQAQEGIAEALVLARDTVAGKQLVAYYRAEQSVSVDVLRQRLSLSLPDYMVPSHWLQVSEFALTANGKVDRKALPLPEVEAGGEYEAPQGETEQALAGLWQELLGVEAISRHANFFMLGGHSLLVTRLNYRIREYFGVEVPLPRLLKTAELQEQASLIDQLMVLLHNQFLASEAEEVEEMSW